MYKEISVVPALTLAAYVATDCVGALLTFAVAGNTNSIALKRLTVIDADVEDAAFNLHLFSASPAAAARTDADPYAPVAADLAIKLTTLEIAVADYVDSASDSIAIYELDHALVLTDNTNFYGVLECIATPTYTAADDLTVKFVVELR